jgi:lysophospholipase L1-like esterase
MKPAKNCHEMVRKSIGLFIFFSFCMAYGKAQTYADSIVAKYPFIKPSLNKIENDSVALHPFYEKLYQLEAKNQNKISILHIGDSHIQADFFSGMLRQQLQTVFGNAGRGLIFPYKVARTNEPSSFQTSTNVTWETKRNIFINNPLPIGIGGITIKTTDSAAFINLTVQDQGGLDYGFNKLTLFHEKGPLAFDLMVYNGAVITGFINSNLLIGGPFSSVVNTDKPQKSIRLKMYKRDTIQNAAQIYGILLENDKPGILYNATGVNGAECRHINASTYFFEQLALLLPDLVIISLGTNEAYPRGFDAGRFQMQLDSLAKQVIRARPEAALLFTTPADSYRKKYKNPDMKNARNTIVQYCEAHHYAYWDLYSIMGGYGAMAKWKAKNLGAPDKVHFSRGGYKLQGKLMFSALINGYNKFKKYQHR